MRMTVVVMVRSLDHLFLLFKTAQTKLAALLVSFPMLLVAFAFASLGVTVAALLLVLSELEQIGLKLVLIGLDFEQFSGSVTSRFRVDTLAKGSQLRATPGEVVSIQYEETVERRQTFCDHGDRVHLHWCIRDGSSSVESG